MDRNGVVTSLLKIEGRGVIGSVGDGGGWRCWWEVKASVSISID